MRIESGIIGMESARKFQSSKTAFTHFSIKEYRENGGENQDKAKGEMKNNTQEFSLQDWQQDLRVRMNRVKVRDISPDNTTSTLRQLTFRYLFDLLFSGRMKRMENVTEGQNTMSGEMVLNTFGGTTREFQWVEEAQVYEEEHTAFSTTGCVRTSDGREISFQVDLAMSRSFRQTFRRELSMASFSMCDPLVINLDTDAASLSDQKFYFDIDADGTQDEIAMLQGGSGYLALDKNNDGIINDGSELFGTSSGDGFADLAEYDEDGNGWIDENDEIWSKLKIWCKDENGKDVLYRLADKGVGAICLSNAATDFTLTNGQGATNGAIRSTGIFLYENGNVGTIQHVDVAKYEEGA